MKKRACDRRQFLKLAGAAGLSLLLDSCRGALPIPFPSSRATPVPSPFPSATVSPLPTSTRAYRSTVAIGRAAAYDQDLVKAQLQALLEGCGGLADLVRPGARIGLKPNLTGETFSDASLPAPATELFDVHPVVVAALAELLLDAGAQKVYIMEGLGDTAIFRKWGYVEIADRLGARLVDLCDPAPYSEFVNFPTGTRRLIYDQFYLNGLLGELDLFVSVAKMKCHSTTGVTLSLKNLFGLPPIQRYRRSDSDNNRSAFHESTVFDTRVPRVIVDLNLARPVHLAVVDGIKTVEAGAGSWDKGYAPVQPGLLFAGRDPVAVDAVTAAVMGFDPQAASGLHPFEYADNHLELAAAAGVGTDRLAEIGVEGVPLTEALFPFKTVR